MICARSVDFLVTESNMNSSVHQSVLESNMLKSKPQLGCSAVLRTKE